MSLHKLTPKEIRDGTLISNAWYPDYDEVVAVGDDPYEGVRLNAETLRAMLKALEEE